MEDTFIYLDHNATTPLDKRVLEAMLPYLKDNYANANSTHIFGLGVRECIERATEQLAYLIGGKASSIVFTSGATEAVNLAIKGLIPSRRKHIITVSTEHRAVLDTCRYMEEQGFAVTYLPVDPEGLIDLDQLTDLIHEETLLVSVMLANNETGIIQPLRQISEIVHNKGALLLCDATQAVGKISVDVQELGIDLLPLSAHKFYGPKGIGALYVSPRVKKHLSPQIHGGGQQRGLRSGTLNVPGIVGIGKAALIAQLGMDEEQVRIQALRNELEDGLLMLPNVFRNGHPEKRLYTTANLCFRDVNAEHLIMALQYISVSSGSACSATINRPSHVLKAMGLSDLDALSSIRFSLGRSTTPQDILVTIEKVKTLVGRLRN